jgi:nitroreductase
MDTRIPDGDILGAPVKPRVFLRTNLGRSIRSVRAAAKHIQRRVLPLVAWSRTLCALYYFIISGAFRREQHAVAEGLTAYQGEVWRAGFTRYLLRRNIHRIEKGLIMKPRRQVFAVDYIASTVRAFGRFAELLSLPGAPEVDWVWNVLNDYFAAAGEDPVIAAARAAFRSIRYAPTDRSRKPFPARQLAGTPVSYEQFRELANRRKSVRWYLPKPIPRDVIDRAIVVAGSAPSACNRQPIVFHVFDDTEVLSRVAELAGGAEGFASNFPALAVLTGQLRAYFDESDRHIIYIDGSLAAMSFIFALETMGVASCIVNWPDVEWRERKMAKQLDLAPDERVVMLISLGYPDPDGLVPYSQKKDISELRSYNA